MSRIAACLLMAAVWLPAADFPRILIHNFNDRPPMPPEQIRALARRDLVILSSIFRKDYQDIAEIRRLNPKIIILQYALTYQVAYDDRGRLSNDDEVALFRDHPESWLTTGTAATIAHPVKPEDRKIVLSKTMREGRFLPVILCGAELMRVERMEDGSVEVLRGLLGTPVQSHPAGAPVSIVAQPPSWTEYYRTVTPKSEVVDINISDKAPQIDGKRPWEIKADFLIKSWKDPEWRKAFDGFFMDEGQATPALEAGERLLARRLREQCGEALVLVFNNLNKVIPEASGRHREHFVDMHLAENSKDWSSQFLNWAYSMEPFHAWSELGHPPVAPLNTSQPGSWKDFRQVRFGLASALLYGGYYQYRAFSGDRGNAKYWFDEYSVDSHGKATSGDACRNWLGKPLGPARQMVTPLASANRMSRAAWEATNAELDQQGDSVRVTMPGRGEAVLSARGEGSLIAGTEYALSLNARASSARLIDLVIGGARASIYVKPQWDRHVLTLFIPKSSATFELKFETGNQGEVEMDDILLQEGVAETGWIRQFEHGLAVVNPTRRTQVLEIPPGFVKISGTQDPAHNNGREAGPQLEVGPLDAFLLWKK